MPLVFRYAVGDPFHMCGVYLRNLESSKIHIPAELQDQIGGEGVVPVVLAAEWWYQRSFTQQNYVPEGDG